MEFNQISLMKYLLNDFHICTFIFMEFPFYYFSKDLGELGVQFKLIFYKSECKYSYAIARSVGFDTFSKLTISEPYYDYMAFPPSLGAIIMNTVLNTMFISELDGLYIYWFHNISNFVILGVILDLLKHFYS